MRDGVGGRGGEGEERCGGSGMSKDAPGCKDDSMQKDTLHVTEIRSTHLTTKAEHRVQYRVCKIVVAKRHSTHNSPLNFDLTLASLNCIANHQKWVQSSEFEGHW